MKRVVHIKPFLKFKFRSGKLTVQLEVSYLNFKFRWQLLSSLTNWMSFSSLQVCITIYHHYKKAKKGCNSWLLKNCLYFIHEAATRRPDFSCFNLPLNQKKVFFKTKSAICTIFSVDNFPFHLVFLQSASKPVSQDIVG